MSDYITPKCWTLFYLLDMIASSRDPKHSLALEAAIKVHKQSCPICQQAETVRNATGQAK